MRQTAQARWGDSDMICLLRRVAPLALLLLVTTLAAASNGDRPPYDRALYPHWIKVEGSCHDVRAVVLIRDAEPGSVFFADPGECRVGGGVWHDPYTGRTFSNPSDLDIDHMVPLGNAHASGGYAWDARRRQEYANDLRYCAKADHEARPSGQTRHD